ncbi:MAG TPA: DinB family protein [Acidimicrobiia bacterium]|nr:DinB family protein [Acidimicrobiia bacterium]
MAISPDTKNWTWVLEQTCSECGVDVTQFARTDIGRLIRENAAQWQHVLAGERVRERPNDEMWSPLEYGCHIRDVYRIMLGRLDLMLAQDNPTFANWDQDATAAEDAYEAQDPAQVAHELAHAAAPIAERFDGLEPAQWARTGARSDGSRFTVESLGRYALHDVVHHLVDVPAV